MFQKLTYFLCKLFVCSSMNLSCSSNQVVESVDENKNIIQFDRKMHGFHKSECDPD